jgi:hypothetical protein
VSRVSSSPHEKEVACTDFSKPWPNEEPETASFPYPNDNSAMENQH